MERSRGVTFLSLAFFALGTFLVVVSVWGLRDLVSWGLLRLLDSVLLAAFLAVGLTCSVAATALFQLRNWGRQLIMALSLVGAPVGFVALLVPPDLLSSSSTFLAFISYKLPHFNIIGGVAAIFLGLTALWYLSKPRVKFLFWW
ncbi:MAG: hypothetical protein KIH01_03055 [Candidatus Freyarchaeota archaeon]|nr:hypothetical protein [Candidatus Jordarchaeia archaeon]